MDQRIIKAFRVSSIAFLVLSVVDFIVKCVDNDVWSAIYAFATAVMASQVLYHVDSIVYKINRELIMERNIGDQLRNHRLQQEVASKQNYAKLEKLLFDFFSRAEKREEEREKREEEREKREADTHAILMDLVRKINK